MRKRNDREELGRKNDDRRIDQEIVSGREIMKRAVLVIVFFFSSFFSLFFL